jgi:hypothetical protein
MEAHGTHYPITGPAAICGSVVAALSDLGFGLDKFDSVRSVLQRILERLKDPESRMSRQLPASFSVERIHDTRGGALEMIAAVHFYNADHARCAVFGVYN